MAKGKLLDIFNQDLPSDDDFSHITKEVKKNQKTKQKDTTYSSNSNEILSPSKHSLFLKKEKRRGKIGCD